MRGGGPLAVDGVGGVGVVHAEIVELLSAAMLVHLHTHTAITNTANTVKSQNE